MSREVDATKLSRTELIDLILSLKTNWQPVILRKGLEVMDRDGWFNFLRDEVKLTPDRRQYTAHEEFVLTNWWEISNQTDKSFSYAFSTTEQPLHCDNAWFGDPAEINFFVMEKQASEGGAQKFYLLTDLISDLKEKDPDLFERLCTLDVTVKKGDEIYENTGPIIRYKEGVPSIYWNYYRTQKPNPKIQDLCDNFRDFLSEMEKSGRTALQRMDSGDCMAFNDSKILHGRKAFTASHDKNRILFQSMWKI